MSRNWEILANFPVIGLNNTLKSVVNMFHEDGCPIYFFGGNIRDMVLGKIGADIDGSAMCDLKKIKRICQRKYGKNKCFSPKPNSRIIRIGSQKTNIERKNEIVSIDVSSFAETFEVSPIFWEFSINYVVYDPLRNILFDMTGGALDDQCHRRFGIPVPFHQWKNWTKKDGFIKVLRFWNLKEKGFIPESDLFTKFIVESLNVLFDSKIVQEYFCLKFYRGYFDNDYCFIHSTNNRHQKRISEKAFHKWAKEVIIHENNIQLYNKFKKAFKTIKFKKKIYKQF